MDEGKCSKNAQVALDLRLHDQTSAARVMVDSAILEPMRPDKIRFSTRMGGTT